MQNKISGLCTSKPCFHHSFNLPLDTCIDKCSCQIYGNPRWAYSYNSNYWSDSCNFTIGPLGNVIHIYLWLCDHLCTYCANSYCILILAPRMAPDVFEPVTKVNRKRLIHITFEVLYKNLILITEMYMAQ